MKMTAFEFSKIKKLWKLIEISLSDLEKAESSSYYEVEMDSWHIQNESTGICEVCLAGAVMAFTLDFPIEKEVDGFNLINFPNYRTFKAIDLLRTGRVQLALEEINKEKLDSFSHKKSVLLLEKESLDFVAITLYDFDKNLFFSDMNNLMETLKKLDL